MRKGALLEQKILKLFARYRERKAFCLQIHPRRLHDGRNVEKAPFDFLIFHNSKLTAFDAKMCEGTRWPGAPSHQIRALMDVRENGGDGFFLVWFVLAGKLARFEPEQASSSRKPEEGRPVSIDLLKLL